MESIKPYCIDSDVLIDHLRGIQNARDFLLEASQQTVLYISVVSVVELYAGILRREYQQPFADTIIAASALQYNLRLVTRNTKHFQDIAKGEGLEVVSPY